MKLHASHLAERCAERGYTWQEIQPCILAELGDGWLEVDVDSAFYPHQKVENPVRGAAGIGDVVKSILSSIGITEERVSAALGRPCGCSQRAKALNEFGRKIGIG